MTVKQESSQNSQEPAQTESEQSTEMAQAQQQMVTQQMVQQQAQQSQQEQPAQQEQPSQQPSKPAKVTHSDRIAELENKIARMEAIYQLQGQNVVDMEVCADLLMKGYSLEQLKQSKPYLFAQAPAQASPQVQNLGVVKQPMKVIAETQSPKSGTASSEGFVKTLADMLISKF